MQVDRGFTAVAQRMPRLAGLVGEMPVGRYRPPLDGKFRGWRMGHLLLKTGAVTLCAGAANELRLGREVTATGQRVP